VGNTQPEENEMKKYPDVTELFRQKAQRRKRLARLSFEEKVAIVNKWRKLTQSIRKSQRARNRTSLVERIVREGS
jgi:hypothetical protein